MLDFQVGQLGIYGSADVAGQRPGRGGPDEEIFGSVIGRLEIMLANGRTDLFRRRQHRLNVLLQNEAQFLPNIEVIRLAGSDRQHFAHERQRQDLVLDGNRFRDQVDYGLLNRDGRQVNELQVMGLGDRTNFIGRSRFWLLAATEWKLHKHRRVRHKAIAFVHFHLADADAAARAPGHRIVTTVDQSARVALLQEAPNRVVVLLRHGEVRLALVGRLGPVGVGAVPIHPHA